jgi:hypothetical protein
MNTKKLFHLAALLCLLLTFVIPSAKAYADNSYVKIRIVNLPTSNFYVDTPLAGVNIWATVDDPSTSQNPDYYFTGISTVPSSYSDCAEWGNNPCAGFQLPDGVILAPFWTITATDGTNTTVFTLADVRVTSVNIDTDVVRGTINPIITDPIRLSVLVMSPDCDPGTNYVSIDEFGNWIADFSGRCDIVPGSWGALNYHSADYTGQNEGNGIQIGSWHAPTSLTLKGFYEPVDMNGVFNIAKSGSTIPFKFNIFADTTELTYVTDVKSFTYAETACNTNAITDEIETTATGGTGLRYDPVAGQFIYNWKTPKTPGKCYRMTMTTIDGSTLMAYFKLK